MRTTEERVSTLEHVLEEFIIHTDTSLNRLEKGLEDFKKEMNKQWAALAQKMGTLDEDLVAYREWEYMDIINFDEIGES